MVLRLIIPMAASSAIIAAMVDAGVSPGIATISMPTEQTDVIASSLLKDRAPSWAARIIPASSLTGIKAPDNPPTCELAIAPPFFTASFNMASAAVVPCVPTRSKPMASKISATESPTAGVGAKDKSTMPKGTPKRSAATRPTISPLRVILYAMRLICSAMTSKLSFSRPLRAFKTTPGPLTPTLKTAAPSPMP